jgi:hypothetical protein
MPQVQLIDVNVKTDFLGHSYFVEQPAVLSDLILVLRYDRDPGVEHGGPLVRSAGGFWELHDGYPFDGVHAEGAQVDAQEP